MQQRCSCWTVLTLVAALMAPAAGATQPVAEASFGGSVVAWLVHEEHDGLVLTVSGPGSFYLRQSLGPGEAPQLDTAGFPDGQYGYELQLVPRIGAELRRSLRSARAAGDAKREEALAARLPRGGRLAGHFAIRDGQLIGPGLVEDAKSAGLVTTTGGGGNTEVVLTNADGVIRNSLCVGFDCPDAPAFDDSTILMMENNTRIKFGDTSNSPFPNNDWEIEANSSASGGAGYLGFNDCGTADNDGGCADDLVFAVESGARQHALYVESDGDVGIGTSNPVLDLHIVTGNTPAMRLDQDGSSGFTPQVWDIAGNETNFFVRDVTAGSRLPLRIRPGAPTSAIDVAATGNVGFGTSSPAASAHVRRTDGTARLFVEEGSGTAGNRVLLDLRNNGATNFQFQNTGIANGAWTFGILGSGSFAINNPAVNPGFNEFVIATNGDIQAPGGTVVHSSSRSMKTDIEPVDGREVLAKVAAMPVATWRYDRGAAGEALHLGPMAEDFHATFGLGTNERSIALSDSAGVALAAIQGLFEIVQERDAEISDLRRLNADLVARLEKIESALAAAPDRSID